MRVSIPGLPVAPRQAPTVTDAANAVRHVADLFWQRARVAVITGAGVSVGSGIQSYRGENGMYCACLR